MTNKAEELAERAHAEWINCTCVDDCGEKYVQIITKALHEYGAIVRARDAEIAEKAEGSPLLTEAISREPLE